MRYLFSILFGMALLLICHQSQAINNTGLADKPLEGQVIADFRPSSAVECSDICDLSHRLNLQYVTEVEKIDPMQRRVERLQSMENVEQELLSATEQLMQQQEKVKKLLRSSKEQENKCDKCSSEDLLSGSVTNEAMIALSLYSAMQGSQSVGADKMTEDVIAYMRQATEGHYRFDYKDNPSSYYEIRVSVESEPRPDGSGWKPAGVDSDTGAKIYHRIVNNNNHFFLIGGNGDIWLLVSTQRNRSNSSPDFERSTAVSRYRKLLRFAKENGIY